MAYLLDTNILVRLASSADVLHSVATRAVYELHQQGETLHVTSQCLIEFRAVATRPLAVNGLGATTSEAEDHANIFESAFPLLPETPDVYPAWKRLVTAAGVVGKQVHDARLVAVCEVHQVTHLLTFNVGHFVRFRAVVPGLSVVEPARV